MNISSFFIERPIFATVLAILITVAGLLAMPVLPISEYPEIVPPTVVVSGQYPGASPKTIAETVITPLEQQINGVENAIYTNSTGTPDGTFTITVTFKLGTDLDIAQVQTQNRVAQARIAPSGSGAADRFGDSETLAGLDDGGVPAHPRTAATTRCICATTRSFKSRTCWRACRAWAMCGCSARETTPMRLWLNPGKIAARSMDVEEVLAAVREQNVQVAAGQIGGEPSLPGTQFEYIVNARGRLQTEQEFGNIVVKSGANGETTYVSRCRAARNRSGQLCLAQHAGQWAGGCDSRCSSCRAPMPCNGPMPCGPR